MAESRKTIQDRYNATPGRQEANRQRNAWPENRERRLAYSRTPEGRAAQARYRQRRVARVRAIAVATGCQDCGTSVDLHFHHRDPSTKLSPIMRMVGAAWPKVEAEIAKCDVLCGPCHRARHYR